WERCPVGAERAIFTLSVGFAASSSRVGAKGERIATSAVGLLAMTCVYFGAEKAGGQWPPLLTLLKMLRHFECGM
ncbi:MAG TPA: hypothetical protein DFH97_02455, partial [Clostridiales bacterium]|nr:hypothetical protein [Clostridiales bacterium]